MVKPYHTRFGATGCVADGIPMSCSYTKVPQPSLRYFAEEIKRTTGSERVSQEHYSLQYLAAQGAFLINSSLTVQEGKPLSHKDLWLPFMDYLFKEVISQSQNKLIYALLGRYSVDTFQKYLRPQDMAIITSHPASAAYKGSKWISENMFNEINEQLKERNLTPIDW